jgi:hypothetical protein
MAWFLIKYRDFFIFPQKATGVRTFCLPNHLPLESELKKMRSIIFIIGLVV